MIRIRYGFYLTPSEMDKIRTELFNKCMTMKDLCKLIDISEVYMSKVMNQKSSVNPKIIKGVKEHLGIELKL